MAAAARPLQAQPARRTEAAAAGAIYVLYLLTFFSAGLTAVAGAVWAHRARRGAEPWVLTHLQRQTRLFWTGLLIAVPLLVLNLVGEVLKWVLIGFPILWLVWLVAVLAGAWFLWKSATGLLRLSQGRPAKG